MVGRRLDPVPSRTDLSTVFDTDAVDALTCDARGVILAVVDPLDWSREPEHLYLLQEKLNRYLRLLERGELLDLLDAAGLTAPADAAITVELRLRHPATPLADRFLDHARPLFADLGAALIAVPDAALADS